MRGLSVQADMHASAPTRGFEQTPSLRPRRVTRRTILRAAASSSEVAPAASNLMPTSSAGTTPQRVSFVSLGCECSNRKDPIQSAVG